MAVIHYTQPRPQFTSPNTPHLYLLTPNDPFQVAEPRTPYGANKAQYGARVQLARYLRNMRQVELAIAMIDFDIEMSRSTIAKIECGRRNIYIHELAAFAEILDVPVDWLVKGGPLEV